MYKVIKHTVDQYGFTVIDYGVVNEAALNRILDTAKFFEEVEFEVVK